jgi:hypothetical protein
MTGLVERSVQKATVRNALSKLCRKRGHYFSGPEPDDD